MITEDTRLENLRKLIAEFGTSAEVAKRSSTSPSYISQIITRAPSRTGKPRDVGPDLARKLESGCGKPIGWMDQRHDQINESSEIAKYYDEAGPDKRAAMKELGELPEEAASEIRQFLDLFKAKYGKKP